jgi:hypothetical protein
MIVKRRQWGDPGPLGAVTPWKNAHAALFNNEGCICSFISMGLPQTGCCKILYCRTVPWCTTVVCVYMPGRTLREYFTYSRTSTLSAPFSWVSLSHLSPMTAYLDWVSFVFLIIRYVPLMYLKSGLDQFVFFPNATTYPLWTSWSPLPVVADV